MIVCLCCAVCAEEVTELAKEGKTTEDIILETGAGLSCGCCCDCIDNIVKNLDKGSIKKIDMDG